MSVSSRPADETTGADTSSVVETSSVDCASPVAGHHLEETREGGFDELPAAPEDVAKTMPYFADDVIANKYRLTRILGEGGMGAVWLARNLALEIDVAIKLIRHDYANAEGATRLLQEARAAARIGHPCIVRVFDFGTTERADPFIVMEVLQGESLAQTITRKGKLSAVSAVRTLLPVAGALSAAHGKGIVHRDLKPDNIRLVTDDRGAVVPKVVDFGIAKLHHDDVPRETTQAGVILGSPHYMSPEQACGRSDVDHRTDIWAFSVMLYEVITGVRPFEGPNYNALISSILVFNPAPWEEHEIHEPELWELIQKGLEKEPQERWQTMQEFGEALAVWAAQRDVETDAAGNSLRAHWLAATAHRPLSEFPPSGNTATEPMRARMVSEREIRVGRIPSIPDLGVPELVIPNPDAPVESPPRTLSAPPSQPSSLPLTATRPDPPKRRRVGMSAMWIGPIALAFGAVAAFGIIKAVTDEPHAAATQRPGAPQKVEEGVDKLAANPVLVSPSDVSKPNASASAMPERSAVVAASSATVSASNSSRPEAPAPHVTARVTTPVVSAKPSAKAPSVAPPIPTEPNF